MSAPKSPKGKKNRVVIDYLDNRELLAIAINTTSGIKNRSAPNY